MSEIATLQHEILGAIAAAKDEAALEQVRIAALGKSGSVSALLKTLGTMTPDERKTKGPAINALKEEVNAALLAARTALKDAALDAKLANDTVDVTLPVRESAGRDRPHPPDQPGHRRTHHDLRRHGLRRRRRAGHRDRRLQFHQAQFPARPSGARNARHVLLQADGGRLAHAAAHAHLAGADPHHADAEAADPHHHPGPHLSHATGTRRTRRCSTRSRAW